MVDNFYNSVLRESRESGFALAAFNVVNLVTTNAIVKAAEELKKPVIIQVSASNVKEIGAKQTLQMIDAGKKNATVPILVHLDHCTDMNLIKECIVEGFQSVMFDGSSLSYEQNIKLTKEVVDYAKSYNCSVEGEVGVIEGVEDGVGSEYGELATFEDTINYIKKTGVDAIAPAIGTAHGAYKREPNINFELVERLYKASDCHIVLHGGTGLEDQTYKKLIKLGVAKINISTALKHAYVEGIIKIARKDLPYEPVEVDNLLMEEVKEPMKRFIDLFS